MHIYHITFISLLSSVSSSFGSVVSFSDQDFTVTPSYSSVSTFNMQLDLTAPLSIGSAYADPSLSNIQYGVNGSLEQGTPSGFPAFTFQLNHRFAGSNTITGDQFYALNTSATAGETLAFNVSASADLSNGLQLDELDTMSLADIDYLSAGTGSTSAVASGENVIFHFNGREEGTGRYHPTLIRLYSDGTGIIMNADNMGGVNPSDGSPDPIDIDFGEEYVTTFTFNTSSVTIASVPEPSSILMSAFGCIGLLFRRRR